MEQPAVPLDLALVLWCTAVDQGAMAPWFLVAAEVVPVPVPQRMGTMVPTLLVQRHQLEAVMAETVVAALRVTVRMDRCLAAAAAEHYAPEGEHHEMAEMAGMGGLSSPCLTQKAPA
jgi:hypothetical protein